MKKRKWIKMPLVLIMLFSISNPFTGQTAYASEELPSDEQVDQTETETVQQESEVSEETALNEEAVENPVEEALSSNYLSVKGVTDSTATVEWFRYINHSEAEKYKVYLNDELITEIDNIYVFQFTYIGLQPETDYTLKVEIVNQDGGVVKVLGSATTQPAPTGKVIPFKDETLKSVVKRELGIVDREVRASDMNNLYRLNAWTEGIKDLSGLEFAYNLEDLSLSGNEISDISSLAYLSKLKTVSLNENEITDFKVLEQLPNLQYVTLFGNGEEFSNDTMNVIEHLLENKVEVDWTFSWENQINFTSLTESEGTFTVDFPKVEDRVKNYQVYIGDELLGEFLPGESYTLSDLLPDTGYEVIVKAVDAKGLIWSTTHGYLNTKAFPSGDIVTFADPALEEAVRKELLIYSRELYQSDLKMLYSLIAEHRGITDLSGLEKAGNLSFLDLSGNKIENLELLSNLTNLSNLYLNSNNISDITPLSGLEKLRTLTLRGNKIEDISALKDLTALAELDFSNNEVEDISALSTLTNIRTLLLGENKIKVISVLKNLRALAELDFSNNQVEDISVLLELPRLYFATVYNNSLDLIEGSDVMNFIQTLLDREITVIYVEEGEEQPPVEEPGEEQPPVEEPGEEQPPVEEPGEEQPPVEQPEPEQPEYKNPSVTIENTKVTENQIQVSWKVENKESVRRYWVYVNGHEYAMLDKNATEITIKNLQPNTLYKVRLVALSNGTNDASKEVEVRTKAIQVVTMPVINNGIAKVPTVVVNNIEKGETLVVNLNKADSAKVELTKEQVKTLKDKGADLVVENQNVQLQIPLNNLPEDKKIETVVQKMKSVEGAASHVYDFTIYADGQAVHTFVVPITLVFDVNEEQVTNPEDLKVFYFNEESEEWELIPGAVYQDGKVSVETGHFSIFAVFEVADSNDKVVSEAPVPENKLPETEATVKENNDAPQSVEDNKTSDEAKSEQVTNPSTPDKDSKSTESKENKLPVTATNNYTLLLGGIILLALGAALVFTRRKFAKR
ncbi:leucine-rich repeat domain-containing protein [Bacillus sp. 1P02SD]|uniref:leucine-rich repeat domain-containing protein n=1 Tax=Bacillus sp. 1P02SD TaxID=3132264 RepID=UPI0039A210BF